MDHLQRTQQCYTSQAEHFVQTRKKFRPEVDHILDYLPATRPLRVLDLGCGGGRLYPVLKDELHKRSFDYLGVDNAQGMIDQAVLAHPKATFQCADMTTFLSDHGFGSFDCIIALASLQHIFPTQERVRLFQHMYNVLTYGGRAIVINRSFSRRFLKKYPQQILSGVRQSISKQDRMWNDYMIPWKGQTGNEDYQRYYHIYTLHEICQLARLSGFSIIQSGYISRNGDLNQQRSIARNTFLVVEKGIR